MKIRRSIHWVNDSSLTSSKVPPPPRNVQAFFARNSCCGISFFLENMCEVKFSFKQLKFLCADIYFYQEDTDEDPESGMFFIISINQICSAKVILRIKHFPTCILKHLFLQLSVRVTAAGRPPTMACPQWRSWRSTPPPRTSSTGRKKNPLHSISATSQMFWLKKAGFDGV